VQKRSKTFKNIQKHSNFEYKRLEIFEKIRKCVRSFDDEVEAARAYDRKAEELFGEFGKKLRKIVFGELTLKRY